MKKRIFIGLFLISTLVTQAQQVSTLYFLENAPMRHFINPSFLPTGDGFINFTPLGYTSQWAGNNSLTMKDVIFTNNGNTITALHPDADRQQLLNRIKNVTILDGNSTIGLFNIGIRHKNFGYIYFGLNLRVDEGMGLPKGFFDFALNGGMKDLTGVNTIDLSKTKLSVSAYTEISGGYAYQLNDKWSVGGKLKFLMGQAYANLNFKDLTIDASASQWHLHGQGVLQASAPLNWEALPKNLNYETIRKMDTSKLLSGMTLTDYLTPQGYGAAVDLGLSYRPVKQVQITAAINDLGFMYWKGVSYNVMADTTFTGVQDLEYSDYANKSNNFQFDGNKLWQDIQTELQGLGRCLHANSDKDNYARMLTARLNVGVDANFLNNLLGIGIVSSTRYYYQQLVAEVTLGGAVRPCKWFNMAVSYSLINNGKYSNIGAGISLMPYDGINLTLAMDYIPTRYAKYDNLSIPYEYKGMNIALGFSIVWGTNKEYKRMEKGVEYQSANEPIPTNGTSTSKQNLMDKNQVYDFQDAEIARMRGDTSRTELTDPVHDLLRDAMYDIEFKNHSAQLTSTGEDIVHRIARVLLDHPEYNVYIMVYTDDKLGAEESQILSQNRATEIMLILARAGVESTRLKANGMGQNAPIATNLTAEGRALNNRVMFYIP